MRAVDSATSGIGLESAGRRNSLSYQAAAERSFFTATLTIAFSIFIELQLFPLTWPRKAMVHYK